MLAKISSTCTYICYVDWCKTLLESHDPNPGIGKNASGFKKTDDTAKHSVKGSKDGKYVHYRKTRYPRLDRLTEHF